MEEEWIVIYNDSDIGYDYEECSEDLVICESEQK
jgi:hypothetical protein